MLILMQYFINQETIVTNIGFSEWNQTRFINNINLKVKFFKSEDQHCQYWFYCTR